MFLTQLPKFLKLSSIICRIQEVHFPCVLNVTQCNSCSEYQWREKMYFKKLILYFLAGHSLLSLKRISVQYRTSKFTKQKRNRKMKDLKYRGNLRKFCKKRKQDKVGNKGLSKSTVLYTEHNTHWVEKCLWKSTETLH